jgi:hypothetical protein
MSDLGENVDVDHAKGSVIKKRIEPGRVFKLELTSKVAMSCVAIIFEPLTRREEGGCLLRPLTDKQRSQRHKNGQPFGPGCFGLPTLGSVLI